MRPELIALQEAVAVLGADAEGEVLADHPGRRRVVRVGNIVVKAFAPNERAAWGREESGLRALVGAGLAAPLLAAGPLWTATAWVDGGRPNQGVVDDIALHCALGEHLARLHDVDPIGMAPWPVADRLRALLDSPPESCPSALVGAVARMVEPWMLLPAASTQCYVHGDWGTSNVIVDREGAAVALTLVDFEDSHVGDPAEDFKWQVLAGPQSREYTEMRVGYAGANRTLGPMAGERLAFAGAELCLDMLRWDDPGDRVATFHERCLQTLDQLVSGQLPEPP